MIIYYYPLKHTPVHLIFAPAKDIAHIQFSLFELTSTFAYCSHTPFYFWTVLSIPYLILEPHI